MDLLIEGKTLEAVFTNALNGYFISYWLVLS